MLQDRSMDQRTPSAEIPAKRQLSAEHRGLLFAALLMMLIGWVALAQLITTTRPRIGGEIWLFFILLQISVTGTAIPIFQFFSLRLTAANDDAPSAAVIIRRGVWAGILVVTCAWLLIPRALSLPFVVSLALLFAAIEVFLRNRESANE